ncbi:MAG: EMC3/TMCO1 family protein [Candidatus Aenigmatarchaeota archaeon]
MNGRDVFAPLLIIMIASIAIAFLWDSVPLIKNTVHVLLDHIISPLLDWNLTMGFLILIFIISILTTLAQKYGTDQEAIRDMKKEQKRLAEEMKRVKDNPEKLAELQKKQVEFIGPMMRLTMRPTIYTFIPLILLFRWFADYFSQIPDFRFFGFLSWFWFFLIMLIVSNLILRKVLNVA